MRYGSDYISATSGCSYLTNTLCLTNTLNQSFVGMAAHQLFEHIQQRDARSWAPSNTESKHNIGIFRVAVQQPKAGHSRAAAVSSADVMPLMVESYSTRFASLPVTCEPQE